MPVFSDRLRPDFLIIGAQKAGTTALFEYLSTHPDIAPPKEKEINFFMCPSLYLQGLDFYANFFPLRSEVSDTVITFEASPNYLVSAEAPQRILDFDPSMKLIIMLRDPIMRAYSAWSMYQRFFRKKPNWYFDWMKRCNNSIDQSDYVLRLDSFGEDFASDIRQEIAALERSQPIEGPILRHGFYAEQIETYQACFPSDQIYIECNERLAKEPKAVLGEIESFVRIKQHHWRDELLQPIFVGDYKGSPPSDAVEILKSVYSTRNAELTSLLEKEFPWIH